MQLLAPSVHLESQRFKLSADSFGAMLVAKKTSQTNGKPKATANGKKAATNGKPGIPTRRVSTTPKKHADDQVRGTPAIDDPVRMYLMQMGEIPMLTRDEEVRSAKTIDHWRAAFRTSMLASDFVLQLSLIHI